MGINVREVMENEVAYESKAREVAKNSTSPLARLNNIKNMVETLEMNVRSADVGVGQAWVDAYDNLFDALQLCKEVEKDLI